MAPDKSLQLVPRLRFPEFDGASEWKPQRLDEVSSSIFDGTHQTPTYTEEGVPFYSVENLISGTANKFISRDDYLEATRKNKPKKGDILLTRIGKIGHSQAVTWDHEFSVYVTLAVIKASPRFNTSYLAHYLQSGCYQTDLIRKSLQSAVPPKINLDSLRSTLVLLPDMEEQVKIADCLGSLDALIAAEDRKLEALRQHKQGLMQQLFPQPGENVPQLRVLGFSGPWNRRKIEDIAPLQRGFDLPTKHIKQGKYPVVYSNGIQRTHNEYKAEGPNVVTGRSGTIGKVTFVSGRCWPHNTSLWVTNFFGNDPKYVYYFYDHLHLERYNAGSTVPTLNRNDVHRLNAHIPSTKEQQKIADCLGSLDDLIAAEDRKLEALRQHKQGLMQQMFPSVER